MDEDPISGPILLKGLLFILSWGYRGVVQSRNFLYKNGVFKTRKLPCRVISIGNLCVGGTGKTPMTLYATQLLKDMGCNICVISRGYRGIAEEKGGVVTDGKQIFMDVDQAGDEPFMMAGLLKDIPVIVGKDRYKAGVVAVNRFNADMVVLDDGFQHRKLFRDADLVLLDYEKPFGNTKLLPRGRLREPVSALNRGHGLIFTRSGKQNREERKRHLSREGLHLDNRCFFAHHEPFISNWSADGAPNSKAGHFKGLGDLRKKAVFAFSGIADNQKFLETLNLHCDTVVGFMGFPDHHVYRAKDFDDIIRAAKKQKADIILTTQKDGVKIPGRMKWPVAFAVVGIKMKIEEDQKFKGFLMERLGILS